MQINNAHCRLAVSGLLLSGNVIAGDTVEVKARG